ncbi:hypothetical protein [Hydrogenobacter thermophilus]|uniref:COG4705 family protein n=1 Tax=Hydrogenobacter thermophilus TaxID=940 RepID=UPI0030FB692B
MKVFEAVEKDEWLLSKIPEITLLFWLLKIVATTLGETFGDFLSMSLGLGYVHSFFISFVIFVTLLVLQLYSKTYSPPIFWFSIASTTVMGTEISDAMDRTFGLGYFLGSLILSAGLFLTLFVWYMRYKTINIRPMNEPLKEVFFWTAVVFSNSLGTAFGDFLTDNIGLSYIEGAIATSLVIIFVFLLHHFTKLNKTLLFWVAFIFTRPFGATFGDLLTKPHSMHGLALDRLTSSLVELFVFVLLLIMEYLRHENKRILSRHGEP